MRARVLTAATTVVIGAGVAAALAVRRLLADRRRNAALLNETLPVHSKWWRDYAKHPGELLYVALGDSAAQAIGATAPDRGYVGILARRIHDTTKRSVRIANLSISGATVAQALELQVPRLAKLKPDIVTVAIGANDIAHFDETAFRDALGRVFDALPAHALVADLPYFYLPRNERRVAAANRIVRELAAERGLAVVPLNHETRRHGLRGAVTLFAKDWFHPNDRGYAVWADAFIPALDDRLAELHTD